MNKYKMQLGITHEEIIGLLGGQPLEFTFQNNEDLPDIKVEIIEVEEDSALFEQMDLSIDNSN
jgi:hypothetical protein